MALGNADIDLVSSVPAVGGERLHRAGDLMKQRADRNTVVDCLGRERRGDDLAAPRIQADVQLSPRPASSGASILKQPLARAARVGSRCIPEGVGAR